MKGNKRCSGARLIWTQYPTDRETVEFAKTESNMQRDWGFK